MERLTKLVPVPVPVPVLVLIVLSLLATFGTSVVTRAVAADGDASETRTQTAVQSAHSGNARTTDVQTIEVRRVKPKKEKKPSLRFLKENMSFLRARIDGLEAKSRDRDGSADTIDPRWLAYLEMSNDIESAESKLEAQDRSLKLGRLIDDIAGLAQIEARLSELEKVLESESLRLDQIHEDFVGRQRTTLVVLLQGKSTDRIPRGMTLIREDGSEVRVTVGTSLAEAMGRGAIAQADHDFVEPREQWIALSLPGTADTPGPIGYIEFAPVRDQINFIELDLDSMHSPSVESWQARFWSRPYGDGDGEISATW